MIKFTMTGEKGGETVSIIGLGLTEENVTRLRAGQPVLVRLRELGFTQNIEVVIFLGKNEQEIHRLMKPLIGPNTITNIDPRLVDDKPEQSGEPKNANPSIRAAN